MRFGTLAGLAARPLTGCPRFGPRIGNTRPSAAVPHDSPALAGLRLHDRWRIHGSADSVRSLRQGLRRRRPQSTPPASKATSAGRSAVTNCSITAMANGNGQCGGDGLGCGSGHGIFGQPRRLGLRRSPAASAGSVAEFSVTKSMAAIRLTALRRTGLCNHHQWPVRSDRADPIGPDGLRAGRTAISAASTRTSATRGIRVPAFAATRAAASASLTATETGMESR